MESDNSRPININSYNSSDGKLSASIKWLITRIYEDNDIPDNLRDLFFRDEKGDLQLTEAVSKCLSSGNFYTQAASKILRKSSLVTQSIGAVLRALSAVGIEAREADGSHVTEASLTAEDPLKINTHLAFIDSLMMAHLKSVISIEGVVQAISAYTPVEKREEPLDCVDALLFWINKICLLVRDEVERNELVLESNGQSEPTIPEMEDLYEDLCDGTCVCVLLSFYYPNDVPLQRIYFNDPMHINDCRFNLGILKEFCENALPFNPFHFEIEDILYLHESLQPNVNVFLADLFHFFESNSYRNTSQPHHQQQQQSCFSPHQQNQFGGGRQTPVQDPLHDTPPQLVSITQRRFMPIQGIPELRTQNVANRPQHPPPKLNRFSHGSSQRDRVTIMGCSPAAVAYYIQLLPSDKEVIYEAISAASVDSLMTTRSGDSLKYPTVKHHNFGPNTTNFGEMQQDQGGYSSSLAGPSNGNHDTNTSKFSATEAKLQMGELRRQWEASKMMQNVTNEEKRSQASKDAFFRVMSKSTNEEIPHGSRAEILSAQMQSLQEQIDSIKLDPKSAQGHSSQSSYQNDFSKPSTGHYTHPNTFGNSAVEEIVAAGIDPNTGQAIHSPHNPLPYGTSPSSFGQANPMMRPFPQQSFDQSHYALPQTGPPVGSQLNYGSPAQFPQAPPGQYQNVDLQQQQFMLQNSPHLTQQQQLPHNFSVGSPAGGFQLQSSLSQPSALNAMHYQPQQFSQQQNFMTPPYQQSGQYFPQQQQPQQFFMSPQPQPSRGYQYSSSQQQHYMQPLPPQQQQQQFSSQGMPMPMGADGGMASYNGSPANFINHQQQRDAMLSPPLIPPHQQQFYDNSNGGNNDSGGTFRLHQPNASTSRLDPSLELNRNLTNWGLTYRMGERAPRKSWAKNAFRSEQDVSSPTPKHSLNNAGGDDVEDLAHRTNSGESAQTMTASSQSAAATVNSNASESSSHRNGEANNQIHQSTPPGDPQLKPRDGAGSSATLDRRPVSAFITDASVEDSTNPEMTAEMQAKRRALLISQMRRKEKIVAQNEEKEQEISEKRQIEQQKLDLAEQRKLEREIKRQKVLEDYKRKKMEQELGEAPSGGGGSSSARMSASSTTSLNRGHSQPPIGRPKSQSNMSLSISRTLQRPNRTQSNMGDENENSTPRISVPSIAEPSLKLYAKHQPKSNRSLMINALQYRVFPGAVSADQKNRVQCALAQSDSKHFLVLFRDHKCQYRGMYTWDQISDTVYKIDGAGPKICREDAMVLMFKYDSGSKHFNKIPTKHLSATIDGFTIDDQFWQKTKIPHS